MMFAVWFGMGFVPAMAFVVLTQRIILGYWRLRVKDVVFATFLGAFGPFGALICGLFGIGYLATRIWDWVDHSDVMRRRIF